MERKLPLKKNFSCPLFYNRNKEAQQVLISFLGELPLHVGAWTKGGDHVPCLRPSFMGMWSSIYTNRSLSICDFLFFYNRNKEVRQVLISFLKELPLYVWNWTKGGIHVPCPRPLFVGMWSPIYTIRSVSICDLLFYYFHISTCFDKDSSFITSLVKFRNREFGEEGMTYVISEQVTFLSSSCQKSLGYKFCNVLKMFRVFS